MDLSKTLKKDHGDKPAQQGPAIPHQVSNQIDEIVRRLRLLEERYSGLRKKSQFTEQSMVQDTKDMQNEISVLNDTIAEVKKEIAQLRDQMDKLTREVSQSVKKTEFNVLAKYVDYWQPMQFLTRKEAKDLLNKSQSGHLENQEN